MQDTFELAIYAGEFTNLELLRKGLYRLEFLVECNGVKAVPSGSLVAPSRLTSHARGVECEGSDVGVEPGWIDETTCKYYTRSMYCRYMDESFHVGECILFRLTLPRSCWYHCNENDVAKVNVTMRLMRAEWGVPPAPISAAQKQLESRPGPTSSLVYQRLGAFEGASERRLTFPLAVLHDDASLTFLDSYSPIVFDSMNLCLAGMSFHSCLVTSCFDPTLAVLSQLAAKSVVLPEKDDSSMLASDMTSNLLRWGTQAGLRAGNGVRSWLSSLSQVQGVNKFHPADASTNVLTPVEVLEADGAQSVTVASWLFGDKISGSCSNDEMQDAHKLLLQPSAGCYFSFAERFVLVPEVKPCSFRP
jgi:hypothetical protein